MTQHTISRRGRERVPIRATCKRCLTPGLHWHTIDIPRLWTDDDELHVPTCPKHPENAQQREEEETA